MMKLRSLLTLIVLCLFAATAQAQTTIDNTTFSAAVTSITQSPVTLTSATCTGCTLSPGNYIYVDTELMVVAGSYSTGTTVPVLRGQKTTRPTTHSTSAKVFIGPAARFQSSDPVAGACNKTVLAFYPWINISNGYRWLCDNGQNAVTTIFWRAAVPWGLTASSDAVGQLHLPPWIEPQGGSRGIIAALTDTARAFFAW